MFRYDSGNLYWVQDRNKGMSGKLAGSVDGEYRRIKIGNKSYRASRIVWEMHNGKPLGEIDHKNRNTLDNRIENLQDIPHGKNMQNKKQYKNGKYPYPGIYPRDGGKWRAQIRINKKLISIGEYPTIEEAISARLTAENFYDFSDLHSKNIGASYDEWGGR